MNTISHTGGPTNELAASIIAQCDEAEALGSGTPVVVEWNGGAGAGPASDTPTTSVVSRFEKALRRVERHRGPTAVVMHGDCRGAASQLCLAVDVVLADRACTLSFSATSGILPGMASYRLVQRLGLRQARHLLLTTGDLTAEAALVFGIVDHLVAGPQQTAAIIDSIAGPMESELYPLLRSLTAEALTETYEQAVGTHLAAYDRLDNLSLPASTG